MSFLIYLDGFEFQFCRISLSSGSKPLEQSTKNYHVITNLLESHSPVPCKSSVNCCITEWRWTCFQINIRARVLTKV